MASILCRNKGSEHTHTSVLESKICWGIVSPPAPVAPPPVTAPVAYEPPATPRQLKFVEDLGGDRYRASSMTKKECSSYIQHLLTSKDKEKKVEEAPPVAPVEPRTAWRRTPQQDFIVGLLPSVPDGYFAVSVDGTDEDVKFLRITRPKKGRFVGSTKVQTQHADRLEDAFVIYPSGRIYTRYNVAADIEEWIKLLFTDYQGAAMRYARLKGKCCRCNTSLTDAESRWYSIGPECVKYWPWMVQRVEELKGAFDPSRAV